MIERIDVQEKGHGEFVVEVGEGSNTTKYNVTLGESYYKKLSGGKVEKKSFIKKSFVFLLERESKEAILKKFDLSIIQKYFPEYEGTISEYL